MIGVGLALRERRALIVGSAAITASLAMARGLPALRAWEAERKAEAASVADRLALAREGARYLPTLRDTLRARRIRLANLDSVLLTAESPPAAAAELAMLLGRVAGRARVRVAALQLRSDSVATAQLSRVAVRVTGIADVAGLARLLREIEGADTPLVIRELAVAQPEPAAAANRSETLHIEVLVEAMATISSGGRSR